MFHQRLGSLKWRKPDRQNQAVPPDSHRGNKKNKIPSCDRRWKKFLLPLFHLIKMWCQWMRTTANRQMRSGVKGVFCLPKMKKVFVPPLPPLCSFLMRLISSVCVNEWVPVVRLQLSGCMDPTAMPHRIIKSHLHHITVRTRSPSVDPFTKRAWDK